MLIAAASPIPVAAPDAAVRVAGLDLLAVRTRLSTVVVTKLTLDM